MTLVNPASLVATRNGVNISYVDLAWPDVPNNGYKIYRSDNSGPFVLVHDLPATGGYGTQDYGSSTYGWPDSNTVAWQDTTTTVASSYQYRIHAYDLSIPAQVDPGTLSNIVPNSEVAWVVAGRRRYDLGIDVSWQEITGETNYKVYRSQLSGPFTLVYTAPANTSSWNDDTANHLSVYQYKVTVVVDPVETNGTLSNTLTAEPCRAVTGLTAAKNAGQIDLAWTNVEQGDYCHVYRGVDGAGLTFYTTILPSDVSYSDTDVQVGKKYRYGVLQGTATGGGVLASSNEESINFKFTAAWERGPGSLNDEFFELSRKLPEINATISTELSPVFVGAIAHHGTEYTPLIRTENSWQVIGETLDLDHDDTAFSRANYYVYGIRARDVRHNWSNRAVAAIQA